MRYNEPRVLAAGNGFAIAAVGSKLHGFGIDVPEIDNATSVAAGCVAVAVLTDGLRAWTRRPTKNGVFAVNRFIFLFFFFGHFIINLLNIPM